MPPLDCSEPQTTPILTADLTREVKVGWVGWVGVRNKENVNKGFQLYCLGLLTLQNVISQLRRSRYLCLNKRGQDFLLLLLSEAGEERESNSDEG